MPPEITPFARRIGFAIPQPALAHPDWWTWCGSVLAGPDGRHHLYASRWPRSTPFFNGYLVGSRIVHATATDPTGPFTITGDVLPPTGDGRFDACMTHNPAAIVFGGKVYLYYIGLRYDLPVPDLSLPFGAFRDMYRRIRIGVAVADSLGGRFVRQAQPAIDTDVAPWPHWVTTNPSPVVTPEGRVRVYYRTPRPEGSSVRNVLAVAEADHPLGPFRPLLDHPLLPPGMHLEDPFVWWNGSQYEAIAKDLDGNTAGQVGALVHLHSPDGLAWCVANPPTASRRELHFADGRVQAVGNMERPWILFGKGGKPEFLYAAASDHPDGFHHATRTWLQAIHLH